MTTPQNYRGSWGSPAVRGSIVTAAVWLGWIVFLSLAMNNLVHGLLSGLAFALSSFIMMVVFGRPGISWHPGFAFASVFAAAILHFMNLFEPYLLSIWALAFFVFAVIMFGKHRKRRKAEDLGV